jgi:hypothetical protein
VASVALGLEVPATGTPVDDSLLHAVGLEALPAEDLDRLDRHDAVRAAAVSDDLAAPRKLLETRLQLTDRNR